MTTLEVLKLTGFINLGRETLEVWTPWMDGDDDPSYTPEEWEVFKRSVKEEGVLRPLYLHADGELEDGFHRLMAAYQLRIESIPVERELSYDQDGRQDQRGPGEIQELR
jgi:hypothetical protein